MPQAKLRSLPDALLRLPRVSSMVIRREGAAYAKRIHFPVFVFVTLKWSAIVRSYTHIV